MAQPIISSDRAQYAPALQRTFITAVDPAVGPRRAFPAGLTGGALNILDPASPVFAPWSLLSWGQFIRSPAGVPPGIVGSRDRSLTKLISDSGGYQFIGKPDLYQRNSTVFRYLGWLDSHADVAVAMDIPTRAIGKGRWTTFDECLDDTSQNLRDMAGRRRNRDVLILNVLQGRDWAECLRWYEAVKVFPFEGWAFGDESRDLQIMLRLVARMVKDGKLGRHLHVLGTSSLQRAVELTALKRALKAKGHEVEVTFDTATPSIMAANGLIFTGARWGNFTSSQVNLPLDPALSGSALSFPASGTVVGSRAVMGDVLARVGLAQSGLDSTGHALLVHHNVEQLLRNIEEANRWADVASSMRHLGPPGLTHRLRDIGSFLGRADPEKTITGRLRGFVDHLEDDRVDDI